MAYPHEQADVEELLNIVLNLLLAQTIDSGKVLQSPAGTLLWNYLEQLRNTVGDNYIKLILGVIEQKSNKTGSSDAFKWFNGNNTVIQKLTANGFLYNNGISVQNGYVTGGDMYSGISWNVLSRMLVYLHTGETSWSADDFGVFMKTEPFSEALANELTKFGDTVLFNFLTKSGIATRFVADNQDPEEQVDFEETIKTGGVRLGNITITSNQALNKTHHKININATSSNIDVFFPLANSENHGQEYLIKVSDLTNTANLIFFDASGYDVDRIVRHATIADRSIYYLNSGDISGVNIGDYAKVTKAINAANNGIWIVKDKGNDGTHDYITIENFFNVNESSDTPALLHISTKTNLPFVGNIFLYVADSATGSWDKW